MSAVWPAFWQRLLLLALVFFNALEALLLYRERPGLALLNGAMALFCLLLSVVTRSRGH